MRANFPANKTNRGRALSGANKHITGIADAGLSLARAVLGANVSILCNARVLDTLALRIDVAILALKDLVLTNVSVIAVITDALARFVTVSVARTKDVRILGRHARSGYAEKVDVDCSKVTKARALITEWRKPIAEPEATALDKFAVGALRQTLVGDAAAFILGCNVGAFLAVLSGCHLVASAVRLVVLIIDAVAVVAADAVVNHAEGVYAIASKINVAVHAVTGVELSLQGAGSVTPTDILCASI